MSNMPYLTGRLGDRARDILTVIVPVFIMALVVWSVLTGPRPRRHMYAGSARGRVEVKLVRYIHAATHGREMLTHFVTRVKPGADARAWAGEVVITNAATGHKNLARLTAGPHRTLLIGGRVKRRGVVYYDVGSGQPTGECKPAWLVGYPSGTLSGLSSVSMRHSHPLTK